MTLATQIKTVRKQLNLTQEDVSNHLGISRVSVTQWENGQTTPSVSRLRKLAAFFGITLEDLLGDNSNIISSVTPKEKQKRNSNKTNSNTFSIYDKSIRIPILGYAQGNYVDVGNAVKKPIGFLDLSPSFANIVDLYAVYITGESMSPVHNHGDTRLVAPHTPYKVGDTVVIARRAVQSLPETSFIKILIEINTLPSGKVMLHFDQFNPNNKPEALMIDQDNIIHVHKVMTYNEIIGL